MIRLVVPASLAIMIGVTSINGFAQTSAGTAAPVRITITKLDCSRLVRHLPAPDVAYKPGVDVHGKAVAPADLPGSGANAVPNLIPEVLEIPLNVKPMQGKAYATNGLDDTNMSLGTVRYNLATGNFTINGQPLGDPEQQALAEACAKRGVR